MKSSIDQILVFAIVIAAVDLLTGGVASPLYCLLFFPVLFAAQGGRAVEATAISVVYAAIVIYTGVFTSGHHHVATFIVIGMAAAFPATAGFSSVLHNRLETKYDSLTSTNTELTSLLDISQMMNSAFDVDMTLNLVLLHAQTLSGCEYSAVYLRSSDNNVLEIRASSTPGNSEPFTRSISLSDARLKDWSVSETGYVGNRVNGLYVDDSPGLANQLRSPMLEICPNAQSFVCLPLSSVDFFLGFLYVGYVNECGADEEKLARLEDFASRAVFPLHRVLLQQDFQSLAFVDSKTGLDNFRQFDANLSDEVVRADRYSHRFSLIVLDIDHFKKFNDTYGHPAGDALLSQLSVVLRNSLRGVDKPARYGGEEFTVICPETGKEEARIIADRIRENIEQTPFALPSALEGGDDTPVCATVSIGFATYPIDARTSGDLLKAADSALYEAKASGRNVVRCKSDIPSTLPSV